VIALSDSAVAAGFQLLHVTRAESTNEAALKAVVHGADRFWLVADEQTMGRGRHGRSWSSPPGNLYASLGLKSPAKPAEVPLIGFVAGLSLAEAILTLAPGLKPILHLKWPNDCLIGGDKVAGILLEGSTMPGGASALVIGMGVNVAHAPEGLERQATALHHHVRGLDLAALFTTLSARIADNLTLFDGGAGFAAIRERWLGYAMPLGSPIRVRLPSGEQHGSFAGIDANGHLLLDAGSRIETLMVGDVFPMPNSSVADLTSLERAARGGA
jgi:BirA family biotin operon repressor/biotin-[acetyl-CoA-carboxylase] ligase